MFTRGGRAPLFGAAENAEAARVFAAGGDSGRRGALGVKAPLDLGAGLRAEREAGGEGKESARCRRAEYSDETAPRADRSPLRGGGGGEEGRRCVPAMHQGDIERSAILRSGAVWKHRESRSGKRN